MNKEIILNIKSVLKRKDGMYIETKSLGFVDDKVFVAEDTDDDLVCFTGTNGCEYTFPTLEYDKTWRCWTEIPHHATNWHR